MLVKQMEKDMRPGREREKDYRYGPDGSLPVFYYCSENIAKLILFSLLKL